MIVVFPVFCRRLIYALPLAALLLLAGCATRLPQRVPVDLAQEAGLRASFKEMVARQQQCHCCLDAAAQVKLDSLVFTGQLHGFVQAMSPSFVKFVAVSSLGQPVGILSSNGEEFRYVDVLESVVYDGGVEGETYGQYVPEGFSPAFTFYWLIGRLAPGPVGITGIYRDPDDGAVWVEIRYESNGRRSLLHYSPAEGVIRRHIVLGEDDERLLNILYDDYGPGDCPLPGRITVTSLRMNSTLEIRLSEMRNGVVLRRADFATPAPPAFSREVVK
ncbi:MAG: hypothetical protein ABFR97_11095 [Thermodesulfobacteriota bacterium]